ncbi:MAG: outer membrane beta-barrel protein [Gammaproteobacteria bacterium]|nr:outer membrane beta-barrel protein [Gammaproteobacteria bacterium]
MGQAKSYRGKVLLAGLCLAGMLAQEALADSSIFLGGGLGRAQFEDDIFEGDGNSLLLDIGVRFDFDDEPGRPSFELGFMYDGVFSTDVSRGEDDDLDLYSATYYLRYDQPLGDKVWGFAQVGYSEVELEDQITLCFFFDCISDTTYRNKDSGASWGVGINIQTGLEHFVSIGYFDYSQSDIDASSWRFTIRRETSW